ncbi:MAG: fold metallo-hydrolase [Clostridiales bacterium]|jgi:glyoxylase-like metal-dependent hydrolase (beta-lactamase superfamily II)|nr:fold metallo-hydrolase [Clostridiales bacterium]
MIFQVYPAGVFQANCYIVGDENTRLGAIIDPGGDPEGILIQCGHMGLDIKYIILTHGHGDHIGGVYEIKGATGAKILMNKKDEYLLKGGNKALMPILRNIKLFEIDEYIEDGDTIELGEIKLSIIETPGHTPGGIAIKIDDILISGDTLFKGSIGRTDFEFGSFEEIIRSIKTKLLVLEDEINVFPGHGPSTTIGYEKKYNPFIYGNE